MTGARPEQPIPKSREPLYWYSRDLYRRFEAMLRKEIGSRTNGHGHRVRMLDIGTGDYTPFFKLLAERNVELVCIDKEPSVFGPRFRERAQKLECTPVPIDEDLNLYIPDQSGLAFFDRKELRHHELLRDESFDVIMLNCVIHELHERLRASEYFPCLFRQLADWLKPGGCVLVGEQYYPTHLTRDEINQIWNRQLKLTRHASPPENFLHPDIVLRYARWGQAEQKVGNDQDDIASTGELELQFDIQCYTEMQLRHGDPSDEDYYARPGRRYFAAKLAKPDPMRTVRDARVRLDVASFLVEETIAARKRAAEAWQRKIGGWPKDGPLVDYPSRLPDALHGDDTSLFHVCVEEALRIVTRWRTLIRGERLGAVSTWLSYVNTYGTRYLPGCPDDEDQSVRSRAYYLPARGSTSGALRLEEPCESVSSDEVWYNLFWGLDYWRNAPDMPSTHAWMLNRNNTRVRSVGFFRRGKHAWPSRPVEEDEDDDWYSPAEQKASVFAADNRDMATHPVFGPPPVSRDSCQLEAECLAKRVNEWAKQVARCRQVILGNNEGHPDDPRYRLYGFYLHVLLDWDFNDVPSVPSELAGAARLLFSSDIGLCREVIGCLRKGMDFLGKAKLSSRELKPFCSFTTLVLSSPSVTQHYGTMQIMADEVFEDEILDVVLEVVGPTFATVRFHEMQNRLLLSAKEEKDARVKHERAQTEAELLPKWAHGQRGTLFAVGAALNSLRADSAILQAVDQTDRIGVHAPLETVGRLVEQAYENVNLLQEAGSYARTSASEIPRWKRELGKVALGDPIISVADVLMQAARTAFLRLFGIGEREQDVRYLNAFQKFFMWPLIGMEPPDSRDERDQYPPGYLLEHGDPNRVKQFNAARMALQSQGNELSPALLELSRTYLSPEVDTHLRDVWLPSGRMSDIDPITRAQRPSALAAALRLVMEEAILNYIKHGFVPPRMDVGPSLCIVAHTNRPTSEVRVLFWNRARRDTDVDADTAAIGAQAMDTGGTATGLMLSAFLMRAIGGAAAIHRSWDQDTKRICGFLDRWADRLAAPLVSGTHWFATEIEFRAKHL